LYNKDKKDIVLFTKYKTLKEYVL